MSKVSIVITTYNRPMLVIEAIKSCLNQTVLPYEIVVGDDSNNHNTAESIDNLLNETSVIIRYIHNVPSLKQSRNVNMLFESALGDEIMLLHDDDFLLPESVETLSNIFRDNPSVDIAYGKQYIVSELGEINHESSISFNEDFYRTSEYEGSILTPFEAGLSQQIPNNGYMIRAEIAKKMLWRTDIGDGCEYDFGFRLGVAGYKTYFVDKYLGVYRLSAQSISGAGGSDMASQAYKIMLNCKAETLKAQNILEKRLYERAPIAITEYSLRGNRQEALAIYFSKWYRTRMITPRGIKRILHILFYPIFFKTVK